LASHPQVILLSKLPSAADTNYIKMIHPDTELQFINATVGYGVVATAYIPKGTIVWVQDELDRTFTAEDIETLNPLMQEYLEKYSFTNNKGEKVLCWDNAKFVNHSFKSNCMSTAYDFEIAIKDIHPGEQLTDDYGYLNISEPFIPEDEGTERKVVYPDDLLIYYPIWDEAVRKNLSNFIRVDQPLLKFIDKNLRNDFIEVCSGHAELRSIKNCYCDARVRYFGH
jgi:hypothetical protein